MFGEVRGLFEVSSINLLVVVLGGIVEYKRVETGGDVVLGGNGDVCGSSVISDVETLSGISSRNGFFSLVFGPLVAR